MTVRSFLLLLVALLCAGAVQAGDFEDGVAAYNRKDYATALEKLRSAAQQGDIRAQLNLGEMYERGGFVARDLKEAVRWYQLAAQQGAVNAQLNLGKIYELGQGVAQDYKEALRWFQLAARQGSPNGQFNLGFMYESGRGVAQDYKEAVRWYRLAVAQGDQNAKRQLEIAEKKASETSITAVSPNQTETGIKPSGDLEDGVSALNRKDYAAALSTFRSAAQLGSASAPFNLGFMYANGLGVAQDYEEAVRWYRQAALQGNAQAQFNLGLMYAQGQGVAQDYKEAVRWYRRAAQQSYAEAQYRLGLMYDNGQGVAQDYKEAVRWYQLAAAQGNTKAQFNLGLMYYNGQGVAQDYKEAVRWYRLAVAQGDQNAKRQLEIAEKKASETSITVATSNQTETRIKPSDAETERKKRQEVEELLAQERRAKTAELEAANRKQKELEARLRESAERERSASEARVKANEIEELLAQERKAKAAELEAANKKQQELEARLRESAERERLASEARLQPSQTEPTAQAQRPQIAARKERRLALVIGNSNYKGSPLDNPANDATDIASQLKSFGFQTTLLRDATLNQMRDATRKFADQLPSTDVALVYFAGHGIEMKGRNYMIPINADVKFEYELSEQAYDAGIWLEMLETIKSSNADRVNIVILDACRNNGLIAARSLSKGLGKMDAPSGTFLAYSTSPGKIASDGARGERNSPFTKHLIKAMQQANKPIEEVFKEVRRNVGKDTNGSQVPWESTSLTGFFTFKQSQ